MEVEALLYQHLPIRDLPILTRCHVAMLLLWLSQSRSSALHAPLLLLDDGYMDLGLSLCLTSRGKLRYSDEFRDIDREIIYFVFI